MDPRQSVAIPHALEQGTPMIKVSAKKHKRYIFRLDPDLGQIVWQSKKLKIVPVRNIKEVRFGIDTRYYREQFHLAAEYEPLWLTVFYIQDGSYKTLHMIAPSRDIFEMWQTTLEKLHAIRQELSIRPGNGELRQALWEQQYWKGANSDESRLSFADVEKMCRRLNIYASSDDLRRLFQRADASATGSLDFDEFRVFVKYLKSRPEVERLYSKLASRSGGNLDFPTFERFMTEKQQSALPPDELLKVFERYSDCENSKEHLMTIGAFSSFLISPDNAAFKDHHGKVWHDMTRPLADYYISSSHNTYLVGHQLIGTSTIEGYIRALLHGCRSVEVDVFDGDTITEPMIYHGKTLTTKVPLRDVLYAIAKYGFVASPYPIIISAEMYCSVPGQDVVARMLCDIFGERLVNAPIDGANAFLTKLPSPEALKGRILFKTKNLDLFTHDTHSDSEREGSSTTDMSSTSDSEAIQEFKQRMKGPEGESSSNRDFREEVRKAGATVLQRVRSVGKTQSMPISKPSVKSSASVPVSSSTSPSRYGGFVSPRSPSEVPSALSTSPVPPLPSPLLPQTMQGAGASSSPRRLSDGKPIQKARMSAKLLRLLVYTMGVKYRGINKKEVYAPEHMFSLSEAAANRLFRSSASPGVTDGMLDMIKHCRTHLVRLYPKATRVSSSNFEPHRYWVAGMQLVALNWQTFDLGILINHAMFQRNGRAGYVLKPLPLRNNHPTNKELMFKRTQHYFNVTIISAQQLPRPRDASGQELPDVVAIDPYVEVSLHVPSWPSTESTQPQPTVRRPSLSRPNSSSSPNISPKAVSYRTGVVKNNGFNPVWEEKLRIPFECVGDMLDLVFVRFVVRQGGKGDGDPLAVYCVSLGSLEHGYRHLPLHDTHLSQYLFTTLFVRISITDS